MNKFFKGILGINWQTTVPGILVIIGVITKIAIAWRTKDLTTILTSTQELTIDIPLVLGGVGLLTAKAQNVTGVGTQAAVLDDNGLLVTADNKVVGAQPSDSSENKPNP